MPFLRSTKHDIFISYAHIDNIPNIEGEAGWVTRFERQLSVRLLKRFGKKIDIWRDPELERSQLFDKVIEEAILTSGIMISLITNPYLESDYCKQEIKWFVEKAQNEPVGLVVDNYVRIFPILLYNIELAKWPDPCEGTLAFKFHDAKNDEFGEPLNPESDVFQQELRRLVEELHTVLGLLKKKEDSVKEGQDDETAEQPALSVFMACHADALRPYGRQISRALKNEGVEVIENIPPPYPPQEHAEAVEEAVKKADLSIHLLSVLPGEPIDEEATRKSYPLEQAQIGLECARSQLILLPDEFDIKDIEVPSYAKFIRNLREKPRDACRLEVVQTCHSQMPAEALTKLRNLDEVAKRRQAAFEGDPATAFIDIQTKDVPLASDLVGYLEEKNIPMVMIPSTEHSPGTNMSLFEDNLKKAQLFIIVFGNSARTWVELRLVEASKLILSNRLSTYIGIYVAPPRKPLETLKFPSNFEVANNMEEFQPSTLDPLISKSVKAGV